MSDIHQKHQDWKHRDWEHHAFLTSETQKTITTFIGFALFLVLFWFVSQGDLFLTATSFDRAKRQHIQFLIEPNSASKQEILLLPGIGETLAERIIEHREKVAPFVVSGDLELIQGIGPKKRAAIEPLLGLP